MHVMILTLLLFIGPTLISHSDRCGGFSIQLDAENKLQYINSVIYLVASELLVGYI